MSNPWFKFYGAEYLSDPKIDQLTPSERSCWITLLCLANVNNNGIVHNLKIFTLLTKSGIYPLDSAGIQLGIEDEYEKNLGVLEHFESLEMVERIDIYSYRIKNWEKRQESSLTNAERQARYRERNEKVTEPVTKVTLEEKRIEENRNTSDVETSQDVDDVTFQKTDDEGNAIEPRKKKDTSYRKIFELWGKYPLNWNVNRTEIDAAQNLLKEADDLDQIKRAVKFYDKFKDDPFCPQILKPSDLDRKWDALLAFKKKHG